jgi:peptidoglycan/LPS O-acetylase OafA/YrhL
MDKQNTPSTPSWVHAGRIPALDGLRAVAVVLVLLDHAHLTSGFPDVPLFHAVGKDSGPVGVSIFFVLSGFLITTLLCRESDRTGGVSLKAFYLRRVLRIVPAYVCLLLVVAAMQARGLDDVPAADWAAALTYTINFREHPAWELGHAWSLSIEEHFYLLWPLAFALLPRRRAVASLLAVLVVSVTVRLAILLKWPDWAPVVELWSFVRCTDIVAGCLLALLARGDTGRRVLDRLGRLWPVALGGLVAAVALARVSGKFSFFIAPGVVAASLAVLVWAAVGRRPRWLEHPAVVAVGVGSYSLYLWQQLFLNPTRTHWWTTFPQNLLLAGLAAWASYRVIERPFLHLKDRLEAARARSRSRSAAATPSAVCLTGSAPCAAREPSEPRGIRLGS